MYALSGPPDGASAWHFRGTVSMRSTMPKQLAAHTAPKEGIAPVSAVAVVERRLDLTLFLAVDGDGRVDQGEV